MDVGSPERKIDCQTDQYPLLMERVESHDSHEHIIDVEGNGDASSSSSHIGLQPRPEQNPLEDRLSSSSDVTANRNSVDTPNRLNSTNSSNMRRGDGYRQRRRSPLNSGLWISVEVIVTMSQIIASIVVLSLSRDEKPQAPLFEWIVGYAAGCVATLPILYWRFRNRNRGVEREPTQTHQGSQRNHSESTSYTSVTQATDEENQHAVISSSSDTQIARTLSSRLNGLVDHFKMGLDCFFAVWFVVGNVWIFGGHTSPDDAPKLYRLCIVFLTFSCIGYAMPFILCATICCCLPCIISVLGFREDFSPSRGATAESINALPTYKFKLKQNVDGDVSHVDQGGGEGGILAAGTEKERFISGEDAVCCICLAKYADDDELKELPCCHVFHVECIDKWLKINALCPLCKSEITEGTTAATLDRNSSQS